MRHRSLLALAILTALTGAPSSVSVGHRAGAAPAAAETPLLDGVILLGLAVVAAVALVGATVLLIARRRSEGEAMTPAAGIDPEALERRERRRRGERPDDPTLSSIGAGRSRRGATYRGGRAARAATRSSGRGRRAR